MPATIESSHNIINPLKLTDSEIKFYQDEGYLYLGGLVRDEALAQLRQDVMEVMEKHLGLSASDLGQATSSADKLRQSSQYLKDSALNELINGEAIKSVAAQLIGGDAHVYLPFTAVKSGGGGGQFHFHQDNNYTRVEPAMGAINIWVALVDMSPENGCLQIVPRSHRDGLLESRKSDDGDFHRQLEVDPMTCLPIRMRAGDAVAFTRITVHGSGPNNTDQPRVAYALQYHRSDVRRHNNEDGTTPLLTEDPHFAVAPLSAFEPAEA
ncbi:MAG: phytanoyl-CoA dioxygenase family protein [Planctomycetota bacterium]